MSNILLVVKNILNRYNQFNVPPEIGELDKKNWTVDKKERGTEIREYRFFDIACHSKILDKVLSFIEEEGVGCNDLKGLKSDKAKQVLQFLVSQMKDFSREEFKEIEIPEQTGVLFVKKRCQEDLEGEEFTRVKRGKND